VVSDTDESLRFYRDTLGMQLAGESENYGPEQERLNNVFGARLRITALKAPVGPGIEFLEYLAPRDGRPTPADARSNDLFHWQTKILTSAADTASAAVRRGGFAFVSPGTVEIKDGSLGFHKGLLVRDPDGHPVEIIEK
jgi:catechol 2,3-dioxygenase-like lactoylglutathione lyase family enzyme